MAVRFKNLSEGPLNVLVTEGLGPQPFHGRTVVLINEHSHSAAKWRQFRERESPRSNRSAQEQQGRLLGGCQFKLPSGYVLRMPVGGLVHVARRMYRGQRVEPDRGCRNP